VVVERRGTPLNYTSKRNLNHDSWTPLGDHDDDAEFRLDPKIVLSTRHNNISQYLFRIYNPSI